MTGWSRVDSVAPGHPIQEPVSVAYFIEWKGDVAFCSYDSAATGVAGGHKYACRPPTGLHSGFPVRLHHLIVSLFEMTT